VKFRIQYFEIHCTENSSLAHQNLQPLVMKKALVFLALMFITVAFTQSKKEQIELLNFRVDSLKQVINSTIVQISQKDNKITDLENQIVTLNAEIDVLKRQDVKSKKSLIEKDIEIQKKKDEISILKKNYTELRDSLNRSNKKLDTLVWEIPDLTWEQSEFNIRLVLPVSKFEKPIGHMLESRDKKISINFEYNYTHWVDNEEGPPLFFKVQDAINYYCKGLHDSKIFENEGFTIKGKNSTNELVFIKGLYTELESMQGREYGEPNWLWSNTIVLKVTVNEKDRSDYEYITELLERHFDSKSIHIKL
jgi:hypothetical protein